MKNTKVIVGLGSCGLAAGAGRIYEKIKQIKESQKLNFELKFVSN